MKGIDVHGFRKPHRCEAEAQGVPPAMIDKQMGHDGLRAQEAREDYRLIAGSKTGRKFYLDINSRLFDAGKSATAVRELLEEGMKAVLEEDPGLRVVFKEFPILGPDSFVAARAALASRNQDPAKYLEFHIALMSTRGRLTQPRILEIAADVGFDTERLVSDMAAPEFAAAIERNLALARAVCPVVVTYNNGVALQRRCERAWANIDVSLKQRWDQLPNLVSAVKGQMGFEQEVLEEVTLLRAGGGRSGGGGRPGGERIGRQPGALSGEPQPARGRGMRRAGIGHRDHRRVRRSPRRRNRRSRRWGGAVGRVGRRNRSRRLAEPGRGPGGGDARRGRAPCRGSSL